MENICEWENCNDKGSFKAPRDKDDSKRFMWLCENHIKTFNKSWNYFEGMSQEQIETFLKSDATWHRPTQKFGSLNNFFNILWNNALNDKFKLFNNNDKSKLNIISRLSEKDKEAFKTMDLKVDDDWGAIQKKFKALVKKFHPDKNSGNKQYEDHLKKITLAYSHLRSVFKTKKI
jgi:hypothetical protein